MASIQKHGRRWRVQVKRDGKRVSKVFPTKAAAAAWALQSEAELTGAALPVKTLGEAMARYADEVAPTHRGWRWEAVRLRALARDPIATRRIAGLTQPDLAEWRDKRVRAVSPATVAREMTLIRSVLEACRRDWHWLTANPIKGVRWPKSPPARRRRITQDEIDRLALALGGEGVDTAQQRVALAFAFAIETAMRAGEIVGLHWPDVDLDRRFVRLPVTKNGDAREVPLSSRAVEILRMLPVGDGPVFGITNASRDALFRKARARAGLGDLHFHDARAEAIWRLSKKLDVLQLARVIGHRDPKSLMLYYQESAAEMATRLD